MTSTYSLDDLIYKAKWEGLERDEARWAEQQLLHPDPELDRYKVLYLVGKGLDKSFAPLVEPYLSWHEEPELARLALQILCHYWDLTSTYLPFVREFVEGVGWDEGGHIRLVAISIAGAHLRTSHDHALLARLLDLAETCGQPGDDQVRRVALKALARAIGLEWNQILPVAGSLDQVVGEQEVLAQARARLASERREGS